MKINNIFKPKSLKHLLMMSAWAVIAVVGMSACSNDDKDGDPYFKFEKYDNGVVDIATAGIAHDFGLAQQVVIRSNRPWKLVPQSEDDWCTIFPLEGEGDGIIRISADENVNPVMRVMNYVIMVDGAESAQTFAVQQAASEPFLRLSSASVTLPRKGGEATINVTANVDWEWSVTGNDNGWFTITESADGLHIVTSQVNPTAEPIDASLTFKGKGEFAYLTTTIPLTQLGALIYDNFGWAVAEGTSIIGWDTTEEGTYRYDKWTDEYKAHGWTSRSSWLYCRPGFIKLGKTSYGGDAVSPKFSELAATADVDVSFQAVGYATKAGTLDDQILYVAVIGGGTLKLNDSPGDIVNGFAYKDAAGNAITLDNVALFTLDKEGHFNATTDPTCVNIWEQDYTKFKFTIVGATKDTQVVFCGGVFDAGLGSVGKGKNRVFLDNFKVEEK